MNNIVNKFLLLRNKFRLKIDLKFKNKNRIKQFQEIEQLRYIYQNELDEACFQGDMAYEYLKDLPRKTTSDKVLLDKVHAITKNSKYYRYQRGCASVVYISFYKRL